jgi:hypothetical protein
LGELEARPSNMLPGFTDRLLALLPGLQESREIGRKLIDAALAQVWAFGCYKAALLSGRRTKLGFASATLQASSPIRRARSRSGRAHDATAPAQRSMAVRSTEPHGCGRAPLQSGTAIDMDAARMKAV